MRLLSLLIIMLIGCGGVPKNITPVDNFEVTRYLGVWYEIARLDHRFERGLTNVTAEYRLDSDGSIIVINRGFDPKRDQWRMVKGKARFASTPDIGRLKVSFFWPFYGAYNIFHLDQENYSYALVCGSSRSYFWILARTREIDQEIKDYLIQIARDNGFDTDQLIFVSHEKKGS